MESLSIVIQGSLHDSQTNLIKRFRNSFPKAQIIVSTWENNEELSNLVDHYVTSEDPGPFAIKKNGKIVRLDNINRQIVSTRAGLNVACRKWTLKWRSDFDVDTELLSDKLQKYVRQIPDDGFLVLAYHTANPYSKPRMIGHISDWMYFGQTELLNKLLANEPVPATDYNQEEPKERMPNGKFVYSAFTSEQFIIREGMKRIYNITVTENPKVEDIENYLKLIGQKIFILSPGKVHTKTKKLYDNFIYFKYKDANNYFWYKMNTLGEFSTGLGKIFPIFILITWLKIKSNLYNIINLMIRIIIRKNTNKLR